MRKYTLTNAALAIMLTLMMMVMGLWISMILIH